jgi:2-polyprenyl-6-hydroxyphenyl methylase/3-demethylubiquinone-9 3-methyltransferase
MPTRASSPNSASSPTAGGTRKATFRPLHQINPLRLDWIDGLAPLQGKRVLDVGCGGGILADSMARRGADVLGIDLAAKPLKVAQLTRSRRRRRASPIARSRRRRSPTRCPKASTSSPAWRCSNTSRTPDRSSRPAGRLVKPGGWAFFSTINRNAKAFVFAIVGAEHVLKLLPRGTHEYAKFLRPSELAAWCRAASLEPVSTRGLEYNPLSRRYRLSADTSVNYLVACRKPA